MEEDFRLGQPIEEAVITVPAYFFNPEREDTLYAAKLAGLKVRQLINEPTAAALNYGLKHWRENAVIMVYDLGGGTFDVTLVGMGSGHQLESLDTTGNHILGGKDWDDCIVELVLDKLFDETGVDLKGEQDMINDIKTQAEAWKKQLTKRDSTPCRVNVPGFNTVTVTLTREEFERATRPLLDKTAALCEDVLKKKGLGWQNITDVLLVGGSTRMPQVSDFLEKLTGKKPLTHVNPDEAVALGAAMQTALAQEDYLVYVPVKKSEAGAKKGLFGKREATAEPASGDVLAKYAKPVQSDVELPDMLVIGKRDVQAHGMGIISVNEAGTAYINENIIPPNMPIPVKSARSFHFGTTRNGSNELEIFVLEGEGAPLQCDINAKYVVTGIRHERGGVLIRVQYSFDRNGIIHVQARQGDDDADLPIRKAPIDPQELEKFGLPIEATAAKRELTIALALDVSGSMSGPPMSDAQDAMISFIKQYEDSGAKIGVIAVSDRAQWVQEPTDDSARAISAVRSMTCCMTGNCNTAHPFDSILHGLAREDGDKYAIILADGLWSHPERAVAASKACNRAEIETAAIGFGDANKAFLRSISSQQSLAILTTQAELTRTFGTIAQSIGTGGGGGGKKGGNETTQTWETHE